MWDVRVYLYCVHNHLFVCFYEKKFQYYMEIVDCLYVSCSFAFYVSGPVLISVMHLVLSSSTAGF